MIEFFKNGQWTLNKSWTDDEEKQAIEWINRGTREHLDNLREAGGSLRMEMMNSLRDDLSSSGVKDHTKLINGEPHYLAHRYVDTNNNNVDKHKNDLSSWSINNNFTDYWHYMNHDDTDTQNSKKIYSAYIPASQIHSYMPHIARKHGNEKDEGEIIVKPHDIKMHKVTEGDELDARLKDFKNKHGL